MRWRIVIGQSFVYVPFKGTFCNLAWQTSSWRAKMKVLVLVLVVCAFDSVHSANDPSVSISTVLKACELLLKLLSVYLILLAITSKLRMILENIWRRVIGYNLFKISPSNSFLTTCVCVFYTFDINFKIKCNYTKYLNESFCFCSNHHFSFKYFPNYQFMCKISFKLSGPFWPPWALSC